jgi:hypothetical protein
MIHLEMTANEGHVTLRFDVPDKSGEKVRLDELAAFALHLDLVKHRITEVMSKAMGNAEGYDLVVDEE